MKELQGKVCLVTGGTRGIGRATAVALADAGADVLFSYAQSKEQAQEVEKLLRNKGVRAQGYQANVASAEEVQAMATQAQQAFGPISVLVNNAGITRDTLVLRMKRDEWDAVLQTNLTGAYLCAQAVLKPMLKQQAGRIINIASVVGQSGQAGQANYAASKAGLIGFTKALAQEVASRQITVNAVAPGFIETDMTRALPGETRDLLLARVPLRRAGTAEDVAHAVCFLASDEASYITGHVLAINGGMYM